MVSIGERLREERLRRGLDLQVIAEQTKISATFLHAIEADDLDRLPGSFFARSFVRQYARVLGLDESAIEPELNQLASAEAAEPEEPRLPRYMPAPMPAPGTGKPQSLAALLVFLVVIAGLAGTYAVWQRMRDGRSQEPVPVAQQQPPPAVTPASFSPPPSTQVAAAPQPGSPQPAAPQPVAPATPAPGETTPATVTHAEPPASPPVEAQQAPAAVRVELRSTATTWIRATADGKFLFIGNLEPGDSKVFEGEQSVNIRTGNAGGLEAVWNGKPAVSLGAAGQVRTVEFTREAIRFVEASPPKPPNDGL